MGKKKNIRRPRKVERRRRPTRDLRAQGRTRWEALAFSFASHILGWVLEKLATWEHQQA